ncbi:MAG: ribosome silencing factor [Vicinamibacterales bacterium]
MAKTTRTTKSAKTAKTAKASTTAKGGAGTKSAKAPRAKASAAKLPAELKAAITAALDKKALEMTVLDLRKASAFTDFFVICTGANPRQVHAIADGVEQALKAEGVRPAHVEGYQRAEWVLVDYFDFVVHVFSPAARAFYGLERLWGDAVRIEITEPQNARG